MKILITGVNGQVGSALVKQSRIYNNNVIPIERKNWDMAKHPEFGEKIILKTNPDLVINAAAFTDVEKAEVDEENAYRVNSIAPKFMAKACAKLGIPIYHISTDFVFDGEKKGSYLENDTPNPINVYGRTKLLGELAISNITKKNIILRTSWVFSNHGDNFVNKIFEISRSKNVIKIVDDEIGGPTCANCIANCLLTLSQKTINSNQWGIYHYAGFPFLSRYEFGKQIIKIKNELLQTSKNSVFSFSDESLNTRIKRPKNSCLSSNKLKRVFDIPECNWQSSLNIVLKNKIID